MSGDPFVHFERRGDIAVFSIKSPPVNAISGAVRSALARLLADVNQDETCTAIVLTGAGHNFSAGADITEFDLPMSEPQLPELIRLIETSSKPVTAALRGITFGGGLEIALACRFRVALTDVALALPEVKIGLVPGGGGTQRLTRLVGVPEAVAMMIKGDPVDARHAFAIGLIDKAFETDLVDCAVAFTRKAALHPLPLLPRDREAVVDEQALESFRTANARRFRGVEAPERIIEAIRAATMLPFDEGLAVERRLSLATRASDQSKALRHAFFSERRAGKIDGLTAAARPVERVGVVGAGTMGSGIAAAFLSSGMVVTIVDAEQEALDRGVNTIKQVFAKDVAAGRTTQSVAETAIGRLTASTELDSLDSADLIVEAAFELFEVKQALFHRLDRIVSPECILASNTSYLSIAAIAATTLRPERVVGLHFFAPAQIMKLVEVVRTKQTRDDVLATALQVARRIGKTPVVAWDAPGFIGNRMLAVRRREADAMILQGVALSDVDRVAEQFGFAMGPFRVSDLSGLDIGWTAGTSNGSTVRELLCQAGRRGLKVGKGYYDYDSSGCAAPSAETSQIIAQVAVKNGIIQEILDDAEILRRLLAPMAEEGNRIVAEGVAARASDIDVVWLNGYGFPRHKGGPMYWAGASAC